MPEVLSFPVCAVEVLGVASGVGVRMEWCLSVRPRARAGGHPAPDGQCPQREVRPPGPVCTELREEPSGPRAAGRALPGFCWGP